MTVEQADKIDIISIDPTGQVILTVSDHLPWSDAVQHQLILQTKLNKYLAFIESGEILQSYPDSQGRGITNKSRVQIQAERCRRAIHGKSR